MSTSDWINDLAAKGVPVSVAGNSTEQTLEAQRLYIQKLEKTLDKLLSECLASDFNEHWDSYLDALKLLENNS